MEDFRHLEVLEAVTQNGQISQRGLAARLGIALGLTNLYVKRMVRKGYIKCVNVRSNRLLYLITPQGIAEKTRLTYEYMQCSLHVYQQVRNHLRQVLQPLARAEHRVAIYGVGEAAELAYLSLREVGFEPAAIFDGNGGGEFLSVPVHDIRHPDAPHYDRLIVATFEAPAPFVMRLVELGVPPEKLITLRPVEPESRRSGRTTPKARS